MVTPQANKHHMSLRIRNFMIILWICWTLRFKIYKNLYSCPPDLWPVAGPSENICERWEEDSEGSSNDSTVY